MNSIPAQSSATPRLAVIMAGGSGVRLRPLTYAIPKPLLPVGPVRVIEHSIRRLAEAGFERVFILTHYQADKFDVCVGYGERWGVPVELCREPERLGTFGGVYALRDRLADPFLLMNGDLVTMVDFDALMRAHAERDSLLTVVSKPYLSTVPYGVLDVGADGGVLNVTEKPAREFTINAGIYVIEPRVFDLLDGSATDVPSIITTLVGRGLPVRAYPTPATWLDIGQASEYEQAAALLESWYEQSR